MNKLEEEKRLLEQKLSVLTKKKDRYGESKERIDETNLTENKNLENLYLNLDALTSDLSSEREKNSIEIRF